MEISNCLITRVQGRAIDFRQAEGSVTNCTIAVNEGGVSASWDSADVFVTNCIFRDNGPADETISHDVVGAYVTYSCLDDGIYKGSGENNIYADPMFVNARLGDFRLLPQSPCIDAGDDSAVQPDEKDLAGNARIMFGGRSETVDMGAYEYRFVSASRKPGSDDVQLTWASRLGKTYSVLLSQDLRLWQPAADNIQGAETITTWVDPSGSLPGIRIRFYKVAEKE